MGTNCNVGFLIKTDGSITPVYPENKNDFSLKELQKFVGGYIEIVQKNSITIFVVNEEGLIHGLIVNKKASLMCGRTLVGNVLMCHSNMVK